MTISNYTHSFIAASLGTLLLFNAPRPAVAEDKKEVSAPSKPAADSPAGAMASADKPLFDDSFSKLPTNITSDTLTVHQNDRVFIYKGNVIVTQGDLTLTSKTLEGTYNEKNEIQKLVAKGDVVITKQEMKATSQQALYDAVAGTITLADTPQLEQNGSILTADRIKVFVNENRSQAEGTVRMTIVNKKDSGGLLGVKKTPTPGGTPGAPAAAAPITATAATATPPPSAGE